MRAMRPNGNGIGLERSGARIRRPNGNFRVLGRVLASLSTAEHLEQGEAKVRPGQQIENDVARVVRQADLLDHLPTEYVAQEAGPGRVGGDLEVSQGQIAFGKLGLEDVDERGGQRGRDHVERHRQQHDGRRPWRRP